MNCWEFKKCMYAPSCPAHPHHGTQCSRIAGTLCGGKVQGLFAMKLTNCLHCEFYRSPYYDTRQN